MSRSNINNGLIARNTMALFFRMLLTIAIQLYTVPIIIKALGLEDYGLYNVIASIMVLVSLVGYVASGCQRFFSYALGMGDEEQLRKLFNSIQTIYLFLSIVVLFIIEIAGVWFIYHEMQIPNGRFIAAHWVFQLSVISFIVSLITVPYSALMVAHEKLNIFAYISITTSLLKLLVAISIEYVSSDRLIFYAASILGIQLLDRFLNQCYCYRHFEECRHWKLTIDKKQTGALLAYSGYNIIGAIAITLRSQGMNVIMNVFFGTILNAAHGIALQIQGVMNQLIGNLYKASRPQITKSFAVGDFQGMWKLVFRTSLLSYYIIMIISVIALFEIPTLLSLWLYEVPEYTVTISRVFVVCILLETITNQLIGVFQAMNRIKEYQLSSSLILLSYLPVAYLILRYNSSDATNPYYIQIFFSLLYVISIIIVSYKISHLDVHYFLFRVVSREMIITCFVILLSYFLTKLLAPSFYRVIITTVCCLFVSSLLVLIIGFEKDDVAYLRNKLKTFRLLRNDET